MFKIINYAIPFCRKAGGTLKNIINESFIFEAHPVLEAVQNDKYIR